MSAVLDPVPRFRDTMRAVAQTRQPLRRHIFCCAGDIGQVLQAASLLAQLKTLDLSRQAFTGTLPSISIPTLETLNLADNTIQVTCSPSSTHAMAAAISHSMCSSTLTSRLVQRGHSSHDSQCTSDKRIRHVWVIMGRVRLCSL